MPIRCIIVDDEPLALDVLENYIQRLDTLELVARCSSALEAFNILQKTKVDLIFLDIQMPRLTGIDFLKSINNLPKVIFTTAYRDYALEGYELNVADYLLKPISFDRFLKAVSRLTLNTEQASFPLSTPVIAETAGNDFQEAFLYLKSDKKMVKVMLKDILYIESLKDYVRVVTPERQIVTYQKISYLEEKLPDDKFIRIHRSFIIAMDKLQSFSATHAEVGNKELPIGRNFKNEVWKALSSRNLLEQ